MIARVAVASALVAALAPSITRADENTARVLYDQAEALAKQGKWADACPVFDASYKADPKLGALLHLADCHEKIGLYATAWGEFSDAIEIAHRENDPREAIAQKRADALTPKLSHVRIAPPKTALAGLVVKRDGADVTALVGSDLPIDPGVHDFAVSAPGYVEAHVRLTVEAAKPYTLELPALVAVPKPVEPNVPVGPAQRDAVVTISTEPDAEIALDGSKVGTGQFAGPMKPGRHTLRVSAPGAHAYQTEIEVSAGQDRTIDVPALEREAIAAPRAPSGPGWELGFGIAPGVRLHADNPAMVALRLDFGKRIGRRVVFGVFLDYAAIATTGQCGTNLPGPNPTTPFDFGAHNQFARCMQYMAGIEINVHIRPDKPWDPWIGFEPGFREEQINFELYDSTGQPTGGFQSASMIGIAMLPVRAGVDYHVSKKLAVGGFVEATYWIAQEEPDNMSSGHDGPTFYATLFGGVRSSLAF